jgi:HAD superfamily phosphatase
MANDASLGALFFDMDGVLIDVSRSYRRAIEETVGHFTGRQVVPGTVQRYKNDGGFNDDWKLTHAIITDTSMEVPFARVKEEFQKRYRGRNWDGFIAEEPALLSDRTLRRLTDSVPLMGIVTGRPKAEARWTLKRFGWRKHFPLLVPRERHEGRGKPNPFPLQHALSILNAAGRPTEPTDAAYVGDSVDDMAAARAAGLWAIGVTPPYVDHDDHAALLRERGAHTVIDDVEDLPELLASFRQQVGAYAAAPVGRAA